jgi:hypothetical protein
LDITEGLRLFCLQADIAFTVQLITILKQDTLITVNGIIICTVLKANSLKDTIMSKIYFVFIFFILISCGYTSEDSHFVSKPLTEDRIFSAVNCYPRNVMPLFGSFLNSKGLLDTTRKESLRVFVINNLKKNSLLFFFVESDSTSGLSTIKTSFFSEGSYQIIDKGSSIELFDFDLRTDKFLSKKDGVLSYVKDSSSGYRILIDQRIGDSVFVKSLFVDDLMFRQGDSSPLLYCLFDELRSDHDLKCIFDNW